MRCCILFVWIYVVFANRHKHHLVFTVLPGESTCFVKNITKHKVVEIVYKVIESNSAPALISFDLLSPRRARSLVRTRRWPAGGHVVKTSGTGPHRFCFDNNFDRVGKKTIFFDINIRQTKKHNMIYSDVTIINKNIKEEEPNVEEEEEFDMPDFKTRTPQVLRQFQDIDLDTLNNHTTQMFFIVKKKY